MGPEAEDPGFSVAPSLRFVYHNSETSTCVIYSGRKMYDLYFLSTWLATTLIRGAVSLMRANPTNADCADCDPITHGLTDVNCPTSSFKNSKKRLIC